MDAKVLDALKESIAHWERVVEEPDEPIGAAHCALCRLFWNDKGYAECYKGCPIGISCLGTPYNWYHRHVTFTDRREYNYETVRKALAQDEVDFLKSLLPIVR